MSATRVAPAAIERHSAGSCDARWLERLELEHETLAPVDAVSREGDEIVVRRERRGAGEVAGAHVPRGSRPGLLLQAASAAAFFSARGFPLTADELAAARWDGGGAGARLWIPRRAAPLLAEAETPPAAALAGFLRALFARGERVTQPAARALLAELTAADSGLRRGELWVARVLRAFPELGAPEFGPARRRCLGVSAPALRTAASRARTAAAAAAAAGRDAVLFARRGSSLTAGSALPLAPPPAGLADAVRALRRMAEGAGAPAWIALAAEEWDDFSRRAFEAAAAALGGRIQVIRVPASLAPPVSASEWRRALWVPCGTLAASVRFYEALAACMRGSAERPRELVGRILESPGWADFVADPTGDAPLPDAPPEPAGAPAAAAASLPREPGARVEALLGSGRDAAALDEAERWIRSRAERGVETWFPLAARLAAAAGASAPAWLEAIEAEREVAGGRPREARARLDRLAGRPGIAPEARRAAKLRAAELTSLLGLHAEAARRAATWRRENREAAVPETARALRLGAYGLAREGRLDCASALLDEADRAEAAARRPPSERVETALVRARCLSLAGRFEEEDALYARLRPDALRDGDETAARFLAQEARALLDRRDYAGASLRLEEALAQGGDDPSRRAELLLDLAATAYHAGDAFRSRALLERCREAAAAAGREDLARLARSNRVELLVRAAEFDEAESESAALEREARAEGDDVRLLVALHHRGRIAVRRGRLEEASRRNAEARALAERLGDRIEIGELLLEEGDLALYLGDAGRAQAAWEAAAAAPDDRSERRAGARERLAALAARDSGAVPLDERDALDRELARDPYAAAERVARWQCLYGAAAVDPETRDRAAAVLARSGGAALAARVFGGEGAAGQSAAWRRLRRVIRDALGGGAANGDGREALASVGLAGLAVRDGEGRTVLALGEPETPGQAEDWRPLDAGAARLAMRAWPAPGRETASALALLLETLLFTDPAPESSADFVAGWLRAGVVTGDASMEEPWARLARFAPQSVTVLVLGESGSGKEAVARAIHGLSARAAGPFVPVNVPAIPAALLESELFGHARGAFTGAERDRRGLLEEAGSGTIFFDEIGDLALPVQAKLLRALQEREIRRVGENRSRAVDVRVVSATSRDLARESEAGRFREDLYYRLHVAVIRLPPLRDRGGDALRLARHFLARYAREYGKGELRLAPDAAAAIAAHPWPGNVRELQNAIAQAAALSERDGSVGAELLPESVRPSRPAAAPSVGGYRVRVDAHRRSLIADALDRARGNRTRAARDLGLSRQALLYLIKELKVEVPARKP